MRVLAASAVAGFGQGLSEALPSGAGQVGRIGSAFHSDSVLEPRRLFDMILIRNWPDYNTALVQTGSLTLWLPPGVLLNWHDQGRAGKRGKPRLYSDQAIACALRLREVYRLPCGPPRSAASAARAAGYKRARPMLQHPEPQASTE